MFLQRKKSYDGFRNLILKGWSKLNINFLSLFLKLSTSKFSKVYWQLLARFRLIVVCRVEKVQNMENGNRYWPDRMMKLRTKLTQHRGGQQKVVSKYPR